MRKEIRTAPPPSPEVEPPPGARPAALELLEEWEGRRRRRRRLAAGAGLAAVAALAAAGALFGAAGSGRSGSGWAVRRGAIRHIVAVSGKVEGVLDATVGSRVPGRVREVRVGVGDRVRRGEIIAALENDDLAAAVEAARAAVVAAEADMAEIEAGPRDHEVTIARAEADQARADLEFRRAELAREKKLWDRTATSADQLDLARTRCDAAQGAAAAADGRLALRLAGARTEVRARTRAELAGRRAALAQAEALFEATLVRAPFDGVVARRHVDPGESIGVQLSTPIVRLVDTATRRVRVEIDEAHIRDVVVGQPVRIRTPAFAGEVFGGKVASIGIDVGKKKVYAFAEGEMIDAKVLEAVVDLEPEAAKRLPFGLAVDAEIVVAEREGVLVVPRSAVRPGMRGAEVDVRRAGRAERAAVRLGAMDGADVEVLDGLVEGDVVLVDVESRGRPR